MKPVYDRHGITVHHADCLDLLRALPDASVHAVVTDPPAGIGFMGRDWDSDKGGRRQWVGWLTECMAEALRVLKPGAHGLVWAMPRTSHWTAWALEDAGFEIRDCIIHLYGSGFPKSLDVSKAIDKAAGAEREVVGIHRRHGGGSPSSGSMSGDLGTASELPLTAPATAAARQWQGWGTALKPASEHWWLIRKPLAGTVASNVQAHGTGAINVDACRVPGPSWTFTHSDKTGRSAGVMGKPAAREGVAESNPAGRWPTNVVLDEHAAAELDQQSGISTQPSKGVRGRGSDIYANGKGYANTVAEVGQTVGYGDTGGASRFFPTFRYEAKAPAAERPKAGGKAHPTVKPLALMQWMVRLVTPPGGTVLDCFAGTGTTGHAARAEGFKAILIEREADHIPLIVSRLDGYREPEPEQTGPDAQPEAVDLLDLLDLEAS